MNLRFFLSASLIALASGSVADQAVILDYNSARDDYVYPKLYRNGGKTFYCHADFSSRSGLQVEHVYPASWMKETAGCPKHKSRKYCRANYDRFNIMEADLHNLFPAIKQVNQDRSNYPFAIIGSDDSDKTYSYLFKRQPGMCDFEVDPDSGLVEPPTNVRGDVARALLYIHYEYGAPLKQPMASLVLKWNKDDPPSSHEKWRNNRIEELQGTRNPFIDDPSAADSLSIATENVDAASSDRECRIKGNISRGGKIYHVPGSYHYDRVRINRAKGERWFCTIEEAISAGWRQAE